jgi:hypothetical protein
MSKIWPYATIRELLAMADAQGESRAVLASVREAELFRFAIFSFRKANTPVGPRYDDIVVTLDGNNVIMRKRAEPVVTILQEQQEV